MSEWALRRFWSKATAAETDDGWSVLLDARPLRTPAKRVLTAPTQGLAEAVAAEWDAQEGEVNPAKMPMTRLANSALDKVATQHAVVATLVADYGGSDLLCYRADGPQQLVDRQMTLWDPLLEWVANTHGIVLEVQTGLMPVAQPRESLQRIHNHTQDLSNHVLTGFHDLVSLSGSWVIGYAALTEHMPVDALWDIALIDEIWQAEQWGEDEEAMEVRANKRNAFLDALRFTQLAR